MKHLEVTELLKRMVTYTKKEREDDKKRLEEAGKVKLKVHMDHSKKYNKDS